MGLIITSPLHTNQGETSEMYVNIETLIIKKNSINNVVINSYINKITRENNIRNKCNTFEVPNIMTLNLTVEELASNNLFPLIYTKIKTILEDLELTVINDISDIDKSNDKSVSFGNKSIN